MRSQLWVHNVYICTTHGPGLTCVDIIVDYIGIQSYMSLSFDTCPCNQNRGTSPHCIHVLHLPMGSSHWMIVLLIILDLESSHIPHCHSTYEHAIRWIHNAYMYHLWSSAPWWLILCVDIICFQSHTSAKRITHLYRQVLCYLSMAAGERQEAAEDQYQERAVIHVYT